MNTFEGRVAILTGGVREHGLLVAKEVAKVDVNDLGGDAALTRSTSNSTAACDAPQWCFSLGAVERSAAVKGRCARERTSGAVLGASWQWGSLDSHDIWRWRATP